MKYYKILEGEIATLREQNDSLRKEKESLCKENDYLHQENHRLIEENRTLMEKRSNGTLRCDEEERNTLRIHKELSNKLKQFKAVSRAAMEAKAEEEQISLVGSKVIYDRLNKKMCYPELDPYFIDEQLCLYRWREAFFYDTYGAYGHNNGFEPLWYTDGADDSHCSYTIPFQITKHFDKSG